MTGLSDWAVALDVASKMIYSQGSQVVVGCLLQLKDQLRKILADLCNQGKKKEKKRTPLWRTCQIYPSFSWLSQWANEKCYLMATYKVQARGGLSTKLSFTTVKLIPTVVDKNFPEITNYSNLLLGYLTPIITDGTVIFPHWNKCLFQKCIYLLCDHD